MSNARTLASLIDGSNIVMPSGYGLDFSANANASGMTSEVLDSYEEGTWSVTWSNLTGTPSNTTGNYVKIGSTVYITYRAGSGTISGTRISVTFSLPFTPSVLSVGTMFTETAESGSDILFYTNGVCYPFTFNNDYYVFTGTFKTA